VLIINLEDAVAPSDKDGARETALKYLALPGKGGIAPALRVNALDTAAGLADQSGLLASPAAPDFIVLPMTESAAHLRIVKATYPVFAGDTLYAESTILSKRESKSRPTREIVTVSTRGIKQDGKEVMSAERTMLVPRRGHSPEKERPVGGPL